MTEEEKSAVVTHPWGEVTYGPDGKPALLRFKTHEGKELTHENPSEETLKARQAFYEHYKDYYADLDKAESEPDGKLRRMKVTEVMRKYRDPEENERVSQKVLEITRTWFQWFESDECRAYMAINDEDYLFDAERKEWITAVFAKYQKDLSKLWSEVQDAYLAARETEKRVRVLQDHETAKFRKQIITDYDEWAKAQRKKKRQEAKV